MLLLRAVFLGKPVRPGRSTLRLRRSRVFLGLALRTPVRSLRLLRLVTRRWHDPLICGLRLGAVLVALRHDRVFVGSRSLLGASRVFCRGALCVLVRLLCGLLSVSLALGTRSRGRFAGGMRLLPKLLGVLLGERRALLGGVRLLLLLLGLVALACGPLVLRLAGCSAGLLLAGLRLLVLNALRAVAGLGFGSGLSGGRRVFLGVATLGGLRLRGLSGPGGRRLLQAQFDVRSPGLVRRVVLACRVVGVCGVRRVGRVPGGRARRGLRGRLGLGGRGLGRSRPAARGEPGADVLRGLGGIALGHAELDRPRVLPRLVPGPGRIGGTRFAHGDLLGSAARLRPDTT
ncbi:hypothetical protein [Actinomadura parmotrematis]|uniref:Uncharacterized protein n=1 Tax=Actinomadura parmotrematis TaxID=2864039 RepID=A0ABS7FUV2_9ACTN|nr:hypothetical protein [Actinomadura parmotrematis]MBW8483970.1 hypothetical protein [Actinomadura parmotrematis]